MPRSHPWRRCRYFTVLISALATLFACLHASYAQSTAAIEQQGNMVLMDVKLDNGRTAHMLLDTGAATTVFNRAGAARLKLKTVRAAREFRSFFAATGKFAHVTIGSQTIDQVPFAVLSQRRNVWNEFHATRPVDGSLGIDALARYAVGIDLVGNTITFWPNGHVSAQQRQEWFNAQPVVLPVTASDAEAQYKQLAPSLPTGAVPHLLPPDHLDVWLPPGASLTKNGQTYKNPVTGTLLPVSVPFLHPPDGTYWVQSQMDGVPVQFKLDTGTADFILPRRFLEVLKPLLRLPGYNLSAVDKIEKASSCIFRSCAVGDFEVPFPFVVASTGQSAFTNDPVLGMSLFASSKVLMDFPDATFSFARAFPNSNSARDTLGRLGVFLTGDDGKWEFHIGPGSPAERAGIQDGDTLLSYTGLTSDQNDGSTKLPQADPPITLVVRKKGASQPITIVLERNADRHWMDAPLIDRFPVMPPGYMGVKRFPNGGFYLDANGLTVFLSPGCSAMVQNGQYFVFQNIIATPGPDELPKDKIRIVGSPQAPGDPPEVAVGEGLVWVAGTGWIIGPAATNVTVAGFGLALTPPPAK